MHFSNSFADVKDLVQECVGGAELQQRRAKIQAYGDQTSSALKKHVYANYMQFIETAKEISRKRCAHYSLLHLNSIITLCKFSFCRFGIGNVSVVPFADRTKEYIVDAQRWKCHWRYEGNGGWNRRGWYAQNRSFSSWAGNYFRFSPLQKRSTKMNCRIKGR